MIVAPVVLALHLIVDVLDFCTLVWGVPPPQLEALVVVWVRVVVSLCLLVLVSIVSSSSSLRVEGTQNLILLERRRALHGLLPRRRARQIIVRNRHKLGSLVARRVHGFGPILVRWTAGEVVVEIVIGERLLC